LENPWVGREVSILSNRMEKTLKFLEKVTQISRESQGWKKPAKRLSQLLDDPHHERSIAGSTRRRYGKVELMFPTL